MSCTGKSKINKYYKFETLIWYEIVRIFIQPKIELETKNRKSEDRTTRETKEIRKSALTQLMESHSMFMWLITARQY